MIYNHPVVCWARAEGSPYFTGLQFQFSKEKCLQTLLQLLGGRVQLKGAAP